MTVVYTETVDQSTKGYAHTASGLKLLNRQRKVAPVFIMLKGEQTLLSIKAYTGDINSYCSLLLQTAPPSLFVVTV